MKNPLDKISTLPIESLIKAADDAAEHRYQLEHLEMDHINNPHKYDSEEQQELIDILHLVVSLENEIHAELQNRDSRKSKQWI